MTSLFIFFRYIYLTLFVLFVFSTNIYGSDSQVINISSERELYKSLNKIHKMSGPVEFVLEDGVYKVHKRIFLKKDYITLRSKSGNPESVILNGVVRKNGLLVNNIIDVSGKHVTIKGLTLQNAKNHLIQLHGENDADYFSLLNSILRDSNQQLLKVSARKKDEISSDFGVVKNSIFEYTKGIGPQYYIGGIDLHKGKNWLIKKNTFRNIASPSERVAEHAIHIWHNSSDNTVSENLIYNCDRGIGFGMTNRPNYGGEIVDNIIIHVNNDHPFNDVGIILEESPNTIIKGNTIIMMTDYPNAIEYRFKQTRNVMITGNITNKSITKRNNASATVENNITGSEFGKYFDFTKYLMP